MELRAAPEPSQLHSGYTFIALHVFMGTHCVPGSTMELGAGGDQECRGRVEGLPSSACGQLVGSHCKHLAVGMTGELYFLHSIPVPLPPRPHWSTCWAGPLQSPRQFTFTSEPLSRILVGAQDFFSLCIHFTVTKQMAKNLVVHGLLLVPQMRLSGPQFSCESIFLNENVCKLLISGFFWKPGRSNTLDSRGSSDLHWLPLGRAGASSFATLLTTPAWTPARTVALSCRP